MLPPHAKKKFPTWLVALIVLAVLALACGLPLLILAAIAVPNFLEAEVRSKVARSRADMRSLSTAIEAYGIDNNAYPIHAVIATQSQDGSASPRTPTFASAQPGVRSSLTTPIAYITMLFSDPFAPVGGHTFRYFAADGGWILWSAGPDTRYDIVPERDYNPALREPTPELLWVTYDPTNGTISNGDLWRIRM